jgi:hypothetical protein
LGSVWLLAAAVLLPSAYAFLLAFAMAGHNIARVYPRPAVNETDEAATR